MVPGWLLAGFWGFVAGSALLLGAAAGFKYRLSQRLVAAVMAFGSGVLISALSFELMDEAYKRGGYLFTAAGFISGSGLYTLANWYLSKRGAKHRKRSGHDPQEKPTSESEQKGSGSAIAVGAMLDGIPESIVIGVSLLSGHGVSLVAVIAIFLSNIPEGLSSSSGMKKSGRSAKFIFGLWTAVCLASSAASIIGYVVFGKFSGEVIAATTAVAAGAILSMIVDTMVPEAFDVTHSLAGLITVIGFLASFILSKSNG